MRTAALVLAILGGVFGILFGLFAIAVGGFASSTKGPGTPWSGWGSAAGLAAGGMIAAAIWRLISISFFGALGFLFLLFAGVFGWFGRARTLPGQIGNRRAASRTPGPPPPRAVYAAARTGGRRRGEGAMSELRLEVADGVAVVTMDNPPVNALDREWDMIGVFDSFADREDVRAAVLTGAGTRASARAPTSSAPRATRRPRPRPARGWRRAARRASATTRSSSARCR